MNTKILIRNSCRLCSRKNISEILKFESIPFFDEVVPKNKIGKDFSYPMRVFFCNDCSSVQSQHDINIEDYYKDYQYISSNSPFVKTYMELLVNYCFEKFNFGNEDKVLDVGAADGHLLSIFKNRGMKTLGFEGAKNLCELAKNKGIDIINKLFEKNSIKLIPKDFNSVQLIVLLHTFDHLPDPNQFLENVKKILDKKKGVLLLEVHDLYDIYTKHETSLFGHEHTIFLHYNSISRLLKHHGFKIIEFNFLPKNLCRGSSMLVAATFETSELVGANNLVSFQQPELDKIETWSDFKKNVNNSFKNLQNYIESKQKKGKRFAGYGGWGRGVTTLAMANLTHNHLKFVADINPKLKGCFTPVTHIPILSPESINKNDIDEVIVFNHGYIDEIKKTLSEFIKNSGKVISVIDILNNKIK